MSVALDDDSRRVYRALRASSIGLELGLSVAIGYLVGRWVDGRFDLTPVVSIVGVVIGFAAGIRSMLRTAKRLSQDADER